MAIKPTVMGAGTSPAQLQTSQADQPQLVVQSTGQALVPVKTGSIVLRPEQMPLVAKRRAGWNFATMSSTDIVRMGFESEKALHATLDGFLARLDERQASQVFALLDVLKKGVDDAKLPEILKKVTDGDVGFWYNFVKLFSKKAAEQILRDSYRATDDLLHGRTKTLKTVVDQLERQLTDQMAKLVGGLNMFEQLKREYGTHIADFGIDAAAAQAFLEDSRAYVAQRKQQLADSQAFEDQSEIQELESKFQLLESRALALEGTYTKLPGNQVVIRQIEQAGVSTLQETATTASARFASIKETLLALYGALEVKNLQGLNQASAQLDRQLASVRGALVKDIATTAANAPGDNRLEQARQIQQIIADTKEIDGITKAGREANKTKFGQARQQFEAARDELAKLSS